MKDTIIKTEYEALKKSGMFWEFFPELSGEWEVDRTPFTEFYERREERRTGEVDQEA
jgi:hypothetical protein